MNRKEMILNRFETILKGMAKEALSHLYDVEDSYDLDVSEIDGVVRIAVLDQSVYTEIEKFCLVSLDGLTAEEIHDITRG